MLYMVEMNLATPGRDAEWNEWYGRHIEMLLSIPGIHAAQRFRAEGSPRSPYLAIYEVDGPGVFESAAYVAKAGRASTGEWRELMFDWHRNVFDGMRGFPAVTKGSALLVVDRAAATDPRLPASVTPLRCVGLDSTVVERGLAVLGAEEARAAAAGTSLASRVFLPLMEPAYQPGTGSDGAGGSRTRTA